MPSSSRLVSFELTLTKSTDETNAFQHGYGAGGWAWADEDEGTQVKKEPAWRAWARHEPNNRSHVDGGEGCAAMKGALFDPEYQYEGRWNDERCGDRFSYVGRHHNPAAVRARRPAN